VPSSRELLGVEEFEGNKDMCNLIGKSLKRLQALHCNDAKKNPSPTFISQVRDKYWPSSSKEAISYHWKWQFKVPVIPVANTFFSMTSHCVQEVVYVEGEQKQWLCFLN
jgi:hypothetical protein